MSNKQRSEPNNKNYHAYLLRMWREDESDEWRASVENPHSGERVGFASLRSMWRFLSQSVGETIQRDEVEAPFR